MPSILAIETSCDETSVSILKDNQILSNIISSQIDIHAVFGGVVPEVAARHHLKNLPLVFEKAIQQADISLSQIDAIAVTTGPGLAGSLLVGISFAKGVAIALEKPLIGVNHLLAHVFAAKLAFSELEPPYLALLVSGGIQNFSCLRTLQLTLFCLEEHLMMLQERPSIRWQGFLKLDIPVVRR